MTEALTRIEAELEIRALVSRYADAVVRRDAKAWGETWASDAFWRIMGMEAKGRDAIVALWQRLMSGLPTVVQIPSSAILAIDGAHATGRWYVSEYGKLANGSATFTLGVYHDEYTCADGAWRFASRRFDLLYGGPADLTGTFLPFPKELER